MGLFLLQEDSTAQSIKNNSAPQILLDAIQFKDLELNYNIASTCRAGVLEIGADTSHYLGFTTTAKFQQNNEQWVLLSNNQLSDDQLELSITIFVGDEFGLIEESTVSNMHFKDYALDDTTLIVIPNTEESMLIIQSLKSQDLDTISLSFLPKRIAVIGDHILLFNEKIVHIMTKDFQFIRSKELDEVPQILKVKGQNLYVLYSNRIELYNDNLELVTDYPLDSMTPTDIEIISEDEIYAVSYDMGTLYLHKWGESLWTQEYAATLSYVTKPSILDDNPEIIFYQYTLPQELKTGIDNVVRVDTNDELVANDLLSMDLHSMSELSDTLGIVHIDNQDTIYDIRYTYEFEYSIKNESLEIIDSIYIVSNRIHGFNCAYAQYKEKITGLNLEPGQEYTFNRSLNGGILRFDEICLNVFAINSGIDPVYRNNSSCILTPVSTNEMINDLPNIYPTITSDIVYIDNYNSNSNPQLFDNFGNLHSIKNNNKGVLNLSELNPGIYYLRMKYKSSFYAEKIVLVR